MSGEEWVPLRVVVLNTHVGMLLRVAVGWLLREHRPHVALLQEVQSPLARLRLRLVFPVTRWRLVGVRPPSTGRGGSGTIIATRRDRLRHNGSSNKLLTPYRDRWHPERRVTQGRYLDRLARRPFYLASLHAWHKRGGPAEVVHEHNRQLTRYAMAVDQALERGELALVGGDLNATREDPSSVAGDIFDTNALRTISWAHIDALFVSSNPNVRVQSVEHIDLSRFRGSEASHAAIVATLLVRRSPL